VSIEKASSEPERRRSSLVVRPGVFLTLVILSAFGAGFVIYRLLRGMHI
jgi:hypothetical protein